MDTYEHWLRHPARALAVDAVLAEAVTALQGVTNDAALALEKVGIRTVLDLGASALFANARAIADAADRVDALGSPGPLPADLVDDSARGLSATLVAGLPPTALRALDTAEATLLADALPAVTIRDLGWWPPAANARRLVSIAYGGEDKAADPEAPAELQPRMGRLPVDRVQYEVLLFEQVLDGMIPPPEPPRPIESEGGELPLARPYGPMNVDDTGNVTIGEPFITGAEFPLDITPALEGNGFNSAGIGFVLTIAQSWYSVGLSLGQLLHSLALAPGEATRIAIVDWSRKVATRADEDTSENEALRQTMERKRAVNEVTKALNAEAQSGFSNFRVDGRAEGGSIGGAGNYRDGNYNVTVAGGYSTSNNTATGNTFASSQGRRNVGGEMTQKANDRTQQIASLDRTRRASLVTEVSVSEAERLSTRIVANYNHMHALTVLYFEVVQLYRVLTECVSADPVLYIPVRPLKFTTELIDRYRTLLANAALTPEARDSLLGIKPPEPPKPSQNAAVAGTAEIGFFNASFLPSVYTDRGAELRDASLRAALGPIAETAPNRFRFDTRYARLVEVQVGCIDGTQRAVADSLQVGGGRGELSIMFGQWARPPKDLTRFLPDRGDSLTAFRAQLPEGWAASGSSFMLSGTSTWRWDEIAAKAPQGLTAQPSVRYVLEILDPARGEPTGGTVIIDAPLLPADTSNRMRLAQITFPVTPASPPPQSPPTPPFDLKGHLNANALHYTMALVRLADPSVIGMLLSSLRIKGGSLLGRVDPVPISSVGNYLVFRCPALAQTSWWRALRDARGLPKQPGEVIGRREALVPLASGGVFAEAVLGRFNSAERLDLSRFWNWQDSPIPLVPPEIAPLTAGGRQGANVPLAQALGQANLTQQAAPNLPDPTDALVKAIETSGKGDSFRDMSAVDRLLQNGSRAAELAAQGATEFMKTVMATVSAYGARINKGEEMDQKASMQTQNAARGSGGGGSNLSSGNSAPGNIGAGSTVGNNANVLRNGSARMSISPNDTDSNQRRAFMGPEASQDLVNGGSGGGFFGLVRKAVNETILGATQGGTVSRLFPGLDPEIPEPASRKCCAIFPGGVMGYFMTQYIDPFDLGEHSYGSSGLFPQDSVGQVYTARGGFVDLGHVRDLADMARYLASKAFAWRLPAAEERVPLRKEGGTRTLILRKMVDDCVECASLIGARAAYDLAIWHEVVTWFTNVRYSSFSPEDNFSNLLGSLIGATASATRGKDYNDAITSLLDHWLTTLQAQPGNIARTAIGQLNGLWFVDDDLAPALLGGASQTGLLLRRHVQPLPTVTPWLVTDLNGQSFTYSDPVAGVNQTTISFELGNTPPVPFVLSLPQFGAQGEVITDYYTIEIDVDTRVVPMSVLPTGRTRIQSADLAGIVDRVRTLIVAQYPRGDQPGVR